MKNISKSVRLDEFTYNYVNKFEGDNFNQKFDNLVKYCFVNEEELTKKIKVLDELKSKRIKELDDLNEKLFSLHNIERVYGNFYNLLKDYVKKCNGGVDL